ncbi:MAG: T9SS type A sorting domain-containing protein [Ignavibacteria bacterium]|nr:T9SS type A sorting domain-containing protein [Ignavibacteria bacterium]
MKKLLKISLTLVITAIFVTGIIMPEIIMGTPASPAAGNWYQQFMPGLNGRQIVDITFLDSLTGYAISTRLTFSDSSLILKTTNCGDNWFINFAPTGYIFKRIQFINQTTGYVGGTGLLKTTDAGLSWNLINGSVNLEDLSFKSNDTGWYAYGESFTGGVFFTSNGGASWVQQLNIGSLNPNHIYMVNGRIGFIAEDFSYLRRTTNSGLNWDVIPGADGFLDMRFIDTVTGWKCVPGDSSVRKTTDGGLNWINQKLPRGGVLTTSQVVKFSIISRDTVWGTGGQANISGSGRGVIYRTTNGGDTWKFQIPDTNFTIGAFGFIQFINKNTGWASGQIYNSQIHSGIHTTNGGDTTFLLGLQQISNEVPREFKLYQNYPNPFNPKTNIKYQIVNNNSEVLISVFDITGKHIIDLVNQQQIAGIYEVDFNGSEYSSGVYFYSLIIEGKIIDTKKMLMVK